MSNTEEEQNDLATFADQLEGRPLVQSPQEETVFQTAKAVTVHVEVVEHGVVEGDSHLDATPTAAVIQTTTEVGESVTDEESVVVRRPRPRGRSSNQLGGPSSKKKPKRDEELPASESSKEQKKGDKRDKGAKDGKTDKTSKTK